MNDLTVIFLTANKVPEQWAEYHKQVLLDAIGDTPVISISFKPMDFGTNLIQTDYCITNIYRQILRGAELATTPYVAIVEDDTLYPEKHFEFRPPDGKYGFNLSRWCIQGWRRPEWAFFYLKSKPANGAMIAPRELLVRELKGRFASDPNLSLVKNIKEVGRIGGWVGFYTNVPIIAFHHQTSVDPFQQRKRKSLEPIKAYALPSWGTATEVRNKWK
jgi:hypothetical protein